MISPPPPSRPSQPSQPSRQTPPGGSLSSKSRSLVTELPAPFRLRDQQTGLYRNPTEKEAQFLHEEYGAIAYAPPYAQIRFSDAARLGPHITTAGDMILTTELIENIHPACGMFTPIRGYPRTKDPVPELESANPRLPEVGRQICEKLVGVFADGTSKSLPCRIAIFSDCAVHVYFEAALPAKQYLPGWIAGRPAYYFPDGKDFGLHSLSSTSIHTDSTSHHMPQHCGSKITFSSMSCTLGPALRNTNTWAFRVLTALHASGDPAADGYTGIGFDKDGNEFGTVRERDLSLDLAFLELHQTADFDETQYIDGLPAPSSIIHPKDIRFGDFVACSSEFVGGPFLFEVKAAVMSFEADEDGKLQRLERFEGIYYHSDNTELLPRLCGAPLVRDGADGVLYGIFRFADASNPRMCYFHPVGAFLEGEGWVLDNGAN
ncbi:hypothetical protein BJ508DRAFT_311040 [Ascobolus immersus RN42]|uniref:Uncharacterized protein n=1 Tax=Ascobolus immersus RN42 TaxID=1160509 RepID=A0A3N4HRR0_ASCIM|nr:hypothetical protein BJ508DRAFT_311040 [Ascobolus immersus RN42]